MPELIADESLLQVEQAEVDLVCVVTESMDFEGAAAVAAAAVAAAAADHDGAAAVALPGLELVTIHSDSHFDWWKMLGE